MTQKRKRWIIEEDRVLLNQMTRHANNLHDGFRETARLLNRTEDACRQRWYTAVMHNYDSSMCFITIGRGTKNVNRKVVNKRTSDNTEKKTIKWWKALLKFLKLD